MPEPPRRVPSDRSTCLALDRAGAGRRQQGAGGRAAVQDHGMAVENTGPERVIFGRGYNVWIMAIDGTWRRNCLLTAISATDAELTLEGSIEGLNLKEFFLLLSSTGLAYRRCELVKVNGADIDIHFLRGKHVKKRPGASANAEMS